MSTDHSEEDLKVNNNSPTDYSEGDRKLNNNSPSDQIEGENSHSIETNIHPQRDQFEDINQQNNNSSYSMAR